MKVLYDHQAFTMQHFGGVSKCFCELITHLPADVQAEVSIIQSRNEHLKEAGICRETQPVRMDLQTFLSKNKFKGKGFLYNMTNRFLPCIPTAENINKNHSVKLLKEGNFDIFHPTFFDPYFLPLLKGKPFVLTVHDMMPELFPQYFKRRNSQIVNKRRLVKEAAAIIAVSKQTKLDLIKLLSVPEDKITVIYHGGPKREDIKEKALINHPYFLYVGNRGSYKNFTQTVIDFSKFAKLHKEIKLVCTALDFNINEKKLIAMFGMEKNIIYKSATDKELKNLYANALAFIYPSLYEGFGMPILEAFAYGCPILLNDKSCFPEIAKKAALYFQSDENGSNLCNALDTVISWTKDERTQVKQRGYERLSLFSWEKSALQLKKLYEFIQDKT